MGVNPLLFGHHEVFVEQVGHVVGNGGGGEIQAVADVLAVKGLVFEFQQNIEPPGVGEHFESAGEAVDVLTVFFDKCIKGIEEDAIVQIGWRFAMIVQNNII